MLARSLNSPLTSSVGRLFDAVASFASLRQKVRFEGQAAMELEFALEATATAEAYELPLRSNHAPRTTHHAPFLLDWSPMVKAILADLKRRLPISLISARFHNALAEAIVAVAQQIGQPRVVLSGGCFQNRYLTERAVQRLHEAGFRPYWHQRVPPNDGGISLGQVVAARHPGWARCSGG
jgi:hydrogenase maturation protein HypF